MNSQKFASRSGAVDHGSSYEFLMAAYYGLQFGLNEAVADFKLSTNNDDMGNFDDVVLEVTYDDGEQRLYALQLKHHGTKEDSITVQAFDAVQIWNEKEKKYAKGGDFGLRKYCQGVKEIKEKCKDNDSYNIPFENFHFILYTNQLLPNFQKYGIKGKQFDADEFQLKSKITIYKYDKCVARNLLDLSETDLYFIYKFRNNPQKELDEEFLNQFTLYTKQKDAQEMERRISRLIGSIFDNCDSSVVINYINFFKLWWRGDFGKFKLTKRDIMLKLTEYVLTPHIPDVGFEKLYQKDDFNLLEESFANFDLVVVKDSDHLAIEEALWSVILKRHFGETDFSSWSNPSKINFFPEGTNFPISARGENLNEQSLKKSYITLWHMGELALFVKVAEKFRKAIYAAIKLCENHERKMRFVLLDKKFEEEEFSEDLRILLNLSHLVHLEVYPKISQHLKISLQGRERVKLNELTATDDRFNKIISVKEMIQMLQSDFVVGNDCKTELPKHYISRFCPKILLSFNALDEIRSDIFVISCNGFGNINFKSKTLDLNKYLLMKQSTSAHPFPEKFLIVVENVCTEQDFRTICILNKNKNCHHVRILSKNIIEWVESEGSVNCLRSYQLNFEDFPDDHFVKDLDLMDYFRNRVNVLCAGPGMGKSIMLKFLEYHAAPDYWITSVNLNDNMKLFKEKLEVTESATQLLEMATRTKFDTDFANIFFSLKKVIFLWDGFDELPINCISSVISTMKFLSERGFLQWISTRTNSKEFLESIFCLFSLTVTQFTEENQQEYIYNHLREKFDDDDKVQDMVVKLNQNMTSSLNCGYFDYSGVPLQIYMITEIFLKNPEEYLGHFKILTLADIYSEYIEGKFEGLFDRARTKTNNNYLMEKIQMKFKEAQLLQYEIAALKASFDKETFSSFNLDCEIFLRNIAANRDCLGLVSNVNNEGKPVFAHKTYEEFLTASWLVKNHQSCPNLAEIFFQEDYRNVRLMFDMILARGSPVHVAVIYRNLTVLEKHRAEVATCKDKGGRNPLQIACAWGAMHPPVKISYSGPDKTEISTNEFVGNAEENIEVVRFLLNHSCDPFEKDQLFKLDAVEYSDRTNSLAPLEVILSLKHEFDLKKLRNFCDLNTLLYYSVKFNYSNLFYHLSDYPYIEVIVADGEARTLLQFAVLMDRTDFVATLLTFPHYKQVVNKPYKDLGGPLFSAAQNGNLKMFNMLRENGSELNQNQFSPLITAVQLGFTEFCEKLLREEKIDLNQCYAGGNSVLQIAALRDHPEIMKLLLEHGADANYINYLDHSAFDFCIENKSLEGVKLLVNYGGDINRPGRNLYGYTALHSACEHDNEEIIKLLIESGADLTIKSNRLYTPLHVALINKQENIARILIEADPSVINEYSEEKSSPLMLSALENFYEIIELLAKSGADMDSTESKDSPLRLATLKNFEESVEALIKYGASVNRPDKHGFTPLFYAIGNQNVLKLFLENFQTDVNYRSTGLVTALHFAAENDKVEAVERLLEHGADPDAEDWKNETPLHYAIKVKNARIVNCLLENKASLGDGVEFVRLACVRDAPDCLLTLINHGADIAAKDNDGRSALHFAAAASSYCVKVLIMKGGDLNAVDNQGCAPLCFAVLLSKIDIIMTLFESGADITKGFASATALHLSARLGDIATSVLLISLGCDVNAQDETGRTPLHWAIERTIGFAIDIIKSLENWKFKFQLGNPDFQSCARELIAEGADFTIRNNSGKSTLVTAAVNNNVEVLELCLQKCQSKGGLEDEWQTCLYGAALRNCLETIIFLNEKNLIKINDKDDFCGTALCYACAGNARDSLIYLIDKGADVNAAVEGCTPLYVCASKGFIELVKILIEHESKVDALNAHGNSSLFAAAAQGFVDIVRLLHEHGAEINVIDDDGDTPLHDAAARGHVEVVRFLVSKKADISHRNKSGKVPSDLAKDNGHAKVVEILETSSTL